MFQSTHPCAAFHAASRAISGGPIYVSDTVGKHNFDLLKTLVVPDGSILRCEYYALPTRDCLFEDPLHDGRTMLKIWNLNKVSLDNIYVRVYKSIALCANSFKHIYNSSMEFLGPSTAKEEDGAAKLGETNVLLNSPTR